MNKKIHVIKYGENEDIKEKIEEFMQEKNWDEAYISGGIGSVKDLLFTAPKNKILPPVVEKTLIEGPGELVSIVGEIMPIEKIDESLKAIYKDEESDFFIHLHASVGLKDGKVYGGGLHKGRTFRGLKLYIQEI
ncbi:MAG: PPC domain-containing DNA-binding protein [Miniphocaeibacter sp.]|uniref:PPC domain-containing DNA-binding protein n=1 Tax=Miniphocaeibacter sp. TaxID=3100973 RepID=UPI0017DE4002|nr:DNA-binding protein [Gallicola sp.]